MGNKGPFDLNTLWEGLLTKEDKEIRGFLNNYNAQGYWDFEIFYRDRVLVQISYDREGGVKIEQFSDHDVYRPFKREHTNPVTALSDVKDWLHRRCFPKARANRKQLMCDLRIGQYQHCSAEEMLILKQTHGILLEDYFWIRFKGEDLSYDDVKIRD